MRYLDRADAGRHLAQKLLAYKDRQDVIVLALPRGGVPVGYEVARALRAPLDVFLVRKLGVPGHEELAMGAIASGGVRVLNDDVVHGLQISEYVLDTVAAREQQELERREKAYRGDRPPVDAAGRTIVLVDDGLATGSTMRAAITALRRRDPAGIVVAVPVGSASACGDLKSQADDVLCVECPEPFYAVGLWYENFAQMSDDEIRELLDRSTQKVRRA